MALYQGYQFHQTGHGTTKPPHLLMVVPYPPVAKFPVIKEMSERPEPPKQQLARPLHFVNTDAGTLRAKGTGRRTRDVKSHLSGDYRRWKKQQTLGAQAAATDKSLITTSPGSVVRRKPVPVRSGSSEPVKQAYTPVSPSTSETTSDATDDAEEQISPLKQWSAAESAVLRNMLTYGNSDPFSALPLPVDAHTNMHIQLFYEGTTVVCWKMTLNRHLRDLVHNEALMHGVLAISKVIAATYLPSCQFPKLLVPESQQHYGQLLRHMRSHFKNTSITSPELSFELIHAAMLFSFLSQEADDFEVHLKSLKSLIDSMGGVKSLKPDQSTRFLNAERIRGLFYLKAPLVPLEEWAPGTWSQEPQFRIYDAIYTRGKFTMSSTDMPLLPEGPFEERTQNLILDHRDMLGAGSVAAILFRTKQPGFDVVTRWVGIRSHALAIKTAELVSEIAVAKSSRPSLDFCLHASACLAVNFISTLIYYSSNPTVGLSYMPVTTLIGHLKEIANYVRRGTHLQYQSLYLWALFVGACAELASRTWSCDPNFRGSSWCSTNFAFMIEILGIKTMETLKAHLRHYLFPYMFERYLTVLFNKRHELIKLST